MNRAHDETSEALLGAARRLLADHGPDALTVRRIAGEAGMSTMNVYSRFGGKDGVIDELFADGYRRLIESLEAVPANDDPVRELLEVATTYREFARANPTYYGIMFRSAIPGFSASPESTTMAFGGFTNLVARIERAQASGAIAKEFEATSVAAWLWACCHGMVSFELDGVASDQVDWPHIYLYGVRNALAGMHPAVAVTGP